MIENELYKNPLMLTSQFHMCGNAFRVDTYKGCNFGCKYCFANNRGGNFKVRNQISDMKLIEKWFYDSIVKGETNNLKKELLNRYVPLHLGGMSDPFQSIELKYENTKQLLLLSKKYNYPISISTKTDNISESYFEILDPKIHVFQISLIGTTEEYIRKYEKNTPTPENRIKFIKELKKRGFWVSVRIQPLIDINEALDLIKRTEKYVDYYTVEHIKIKNNSELNEAKKLLCDLKEMGIKLENAGFSYIVSKEQKIKNIKKIKDTTKVRVGVGDNDLHLLSDSLNCCGIDLMPDSFNNWIKYNSMYIKMTGNENVWYPKNHTNGAVKNSGCLKDYVDLKYNRTYGHEIKQAKLF